MVVKVQVDLAALARAHDADRLLELIEGEAMSDDGGEIDGAGREQPPYLIPGLPDAPSHHAVDRRPLENDVIGDIEGDRRAGQAKHGRFSAIGQGAEPLIDRGGGPRHLQQHVRPPPIGMGTHEIDDVDLRHVEGVIGAHPARQIEAIRADVGGEDGARACRPDDRDRHQPHRAASRDQHVARRDVEREGGMDRVAEVLLQGRQLWWHIRRVHPDVLCRQGYVFSETAIAVDADDLRLLAEMTAVRAALKTATAGDMALGGDVRPYLDLVDRSAAVEEVAAQITAQFPKVAAISYVGDATEPNFRQSVFSDIISKHGVPQICVPAAGITRFLAGTPPILSLLALEPGLELILEAGIAAIRQKSIDLTEYFIRLSDELLSRHGFTLGSPRKAERRGGHISLRHPEGYRINRALIEEMNVIPDFREPDNIRFGFAPLYTSFEDVWETVERLQWVMDEKLYEKYPEEKPTVT